MMPLDFRMLLGQCWGGGRPHPADGWLLAPDGARVPGFACRTCAERCIAEYHDKIGEAWRFHDAAHDWTQDADGVIRRVA